MSLCLRDSQKIHAEKTTLSRHNCCLQISTVSRFYNPIWADRAILIRTNVHKKDLRMNSYMENKWSWIEGTHGMRNGLIVTLTDADLAFSPGGQTMTLGALCREIGDIEYAYLQSLKTFTQDFSYRNIEPGIESSVAKLVGWYQQMDEDLKTTIAAFSNDDLKKTIERSGGFKVPVDIQLDIYLQALLIFFGKITIYLKIMNKPLDKTIQEYIG